MRPIFQLVDFGTLRNKQAIVSGLNVSFNQGEITVFMGPSGVGKTSAMQSMLGYAFDGLTTIGKRLYHQKELSVGEILPGYNVYIPQHSPFNPNWEIGSFLCRLPWGVRKWWHEFYPETPTRKRHVEKVLQKLGISHRLRATAAELSGGEIQRAALAQLLLLRPEIFVADEMTTGLDPGIAAWVLEQCRQVVDTSQGCAALATHDVHAALRIANQVVLFWPKEIGEQPWVLNCNSVYWDADTLNSMLNISRWSHEYSAEKSMRSLISGLRSASSSGFDEPVVSIIKADGVVQTKAIITCSKALRDKLESSRCVPIRHFEDGRMLLGIAGLDIKCQTKRAILAEIEMERLCMSS